MVDGRNDARPPRDRERRHAYRSSSFRLPVQIVLRPGINYRGFAGQIASGTIQNGDEVVVLPSGRRTRVVGVDLAGEDVTVASAPSSIALRLADDIDISRGERPADPGERRRATRAPRSNRRGRLRARTFRRRSSCAASPSRSFLRADGDTG